MHILVANFSNLLVLMASDIHAFSVIHSYCIYFGKEGLKPPTTNKPIKTVRKAQVNLEDPRDTCKLSRAKCRICWFDNV